MQLALAKLEHADDAQGGSPALRRRHEAAILATVDKGMHATRFLQTFGQQWKEAMREQGVDGLAGAQGVLEALTEVRPGVSEHISVEPACSRGLL